MVGHLWLEILNDKPSIWGRKSITWCHPAFPSRWNCCLPLAETMFSSGDTITMATTIAYQPMMDPNPIRSKESPTFDPAKRILAWKLILIYFGLFRQYVWSRSRRTPTIKSLFLHCLVCPRLNLCACVCVCMTCSNSLISRLRASNSLPWIAVPNHSYSHSEMSRSMESLTRVTMG